MYVTNLIFSDVGLYAPRHRVGTEMILTAFTVNITIFWHVKPCSLAEVTYISEECIALIIRIEDGGSMFLRKVFERFPDCMTSQLGRQKSLCNFLLKLYLLIS